MTILIGIINSYSLCQIHCNEYVPRNNSIVLHLLNLFVCRFQSLNYITTDRPQILVAIPI